MKIALEKAKKGIGLVNPNPMVGAVIVKDGKIISEGWHKKYGGFHAERNAVLECREDMRGADMYVTLEPCCHYGKTPPCTDIIIQSGIKRVFVGCIDDNPKVKNKGVQILREAGIEVVTGILEDECRKLNEVFFHFINTKTPFVVMKYAMTADGKTASYAGCSKWITNEKSRHFVHECRSRYMAVMTGIGTVKADNPMLNCRIEGGKNPIRIICDTNLNIDTESNIANTATDIKTYIATANYNCSKADVLKRKGVEFIEFDSRPDLKLLMKKLGSMNIDSVYMEGGSELNASALESGIVNKLQIYAAPKIIGSQKAKTPVGGKGIEKIEDAYGLELCGIREFDGDVMLEYYVKGD